MMSLRYASGFTLTEALLAILILLVVVSIGTPSFIQFRQNQQITGVGQALLVDLQLARAGASKIEASKSRNPSEDENEDPMEKFDMQIYFFDDVDWCWRVSNEPPKICDSCAANCDIVRLDENTNEPVGDGIVRGANKSDYPQTVMHEELSSDNRLPIGARRGVLQPAQAGDHIVFELANKKIKVWFTATGRAQLCSEAGTQLMGVQPCA